MGDVTVSLDTILWILGAIITVAAVVKIVVAPISKLNKKFTTYDQLFENNKERLNKQDNLLKEIRNDLRVQGDMTYQILDHMATHNNSGGMKAALDKYNSFYRHNEKEETK